MTDSTGAMPSGLKRKRNFLDDEALSDVIIKFGDKQVFAHKVILASGSVWFERAFLGDFSEAKKNTIELHEDVSSEAVMFMLEYLYGKTYKTLYTEMDYSFDEPGYPDSPSDHIDICTVAEKYDIDSLRSEAAAWFQDYIKFKIEDGCLSDPIVFAIQKLVGPDAIALVDQTLVKFAEQMIMEHSAYILSDDQFRKLLANGEMLRGDLALEFLTEVSRSYH